MERTTDNGTTFPPLARVVAGPRSTDSNAQCRADWPGMAPSFVGMTLRLSTALDLLEHARQHYQHDHSLFERAVPRRLAGNGS